MKLRDISDAILSLGVRAITTWEAAHLAGVSVVAARQALGRQVRSGSMISPSRGLWVAVPPQWRRWERVPASWFIEPLCRFRNLSYYVSLLSGAELYGASHQKPQVLQVMVDKQSRQLCEGKWQRVEFHVNSQSRNMPIAERVVSGSTLRCAVPELIVLELMTWPQYSGGLSNVATVLIELDEEAGIDRDQLVTLSSHFPNSTVRRLGWLFDFLGLESSLFKHAKPGAKPVLLDFAGSKEGPIDKNWGIVVNTKVEPD